jgi:hypothetical protein
MSNYNQDQDDASFASSTENAKIMENAKNLDRGYNKIYRDVIRKDGSIKRTRVEIYTSNPDGKIRNAETGEYYNTRVGSADEDLFFSVVLSTGEVGLKNPKGVNLLFFNSPNHYMKHMRTRIQDESTILNWVKKRDARLKEKESVKKTSTSSVIIR